MKIKRIASLAMLCAIFCLAFAINVQASDDVIEIVVFSEYHPNIPSDTWVDIQGNRFALYHNGIKIEERISDSRGRVTFSWSGSVDGLYVHLLEFDGYLSEITRVSVDDFSSQRSLVTNQNTGNSFHRTRFSYVWFFDSEENPYPPTRINVRSEFYPARPYAIGLLSNIEGNRFALYHNGVKVDEQTSDEFGGAEFWWAGSTDGLYVHLISSDGFTTEIDRIPVNTNIFTFSGRRHTFPFPWPYNSLTYSWFFYDIENPRTPPTGTRVPPVVVIAPTAAQRDTLTVYVGPPVRAYVNDTFIPNGWIRDGRTLLPVRALVDAFGGDIRWDNDNRRVYVYVDENTTIIFTIGSTVKVAERVIGDVTLISETEMSVAPYIRDGSTFLPGRYVAYAFDAEVKAR